MLCTGINYCKNKKAVLPAQLLELSLSATDWLASVCSKYFAAIFHRPLDVVGPRHLPTTPPPQPFYGPFSGTIRVSRCQKRTWTLQCKGRLTEADTLTIHLGATPSGLTSAYLQRPLYFLQARCPCCRPTNSVKALKASFAYNAYAIIRPWICITSANTINVCIHVCKHGHFSTNTLNGKYLKAMLSMNIIIVLTKSFVDTKDKGQHCWLHATATQFIITYSLKSQMICMMSCTVTCLQQSANLNSTANTGPLFLSL